MTMTFDEAVEQANGICNSYQIWVEADGRVSGANLRALMQDSKFAVPALLYLMVKDGAAGYMREPYWKPNTQMDTFDILCPLNDTKGYTNSNKTCPNDHEGTLKHFHVNPADWDCATAYLMMIREHCWQGEGWYRDGETWYYLDAMYEFMCWLYEHESFDEFADDVMEG